MNDNTTLKKEFLSTFLFALGYGFVFYLINIFFFKIGGSYFLPDERTLARWDAGIYFDVSQHGYANRAASVFVLFPIIWHLLHVGYLGMALCNYVIFSIGFSMICSMYKLSTAEKLIWLTTPSLYFTMVPYSESIFFVFAAITIYGIYSKNKALIVAGLFFVCLSRATSAFLLPSLLVVSMLGTSKKAIWPAIRNYLVYYASPVIAGTATFMAIQYYYTGDWFHYYNGQVENLGHKLSMPALPFSDFYGEDRMLWLNALALFVCFVALLLLLVKIYKWLFKSVEDTNSIYILSLSYLSVVMFAMVFCNPKWGTMTTNLLGMHRYVFCSPFIFIFLYELINRPGGYSVKSILLTVLLCNFVWLSFNSYEHIQKLLFYNFGTMFVIAYMAYSRNKNSWVPMAITAVNIFFQIWFFQQYLAGWFTE